jgi:hypothetical protein
LLCDQQAFVEEVVSAAVLEAAPSVSIGLPPSAGELRNRSQRQPRVLADPLVTAEFDGGVGVGIGEVQSEAETDHADSHDDDEYSADHEAESPSPRPKPQLVWGDVPVKVVTDLLSPTDQAMAQIEPLAVDEYSADDFVPEEEIDPVQAVLKSMPTILKDFEVTEATLPSQEPYKPIGLPPPPRFPQRMCFLGFLLVFVSYQRCFLFHNVLHSCTSVRSSYV